MPKRRDLSKAWVSEDPAEQLSDPERGDLERPVAEEGLLVHPEVQLFGDRLVFGGYPIKRVHPGRGMLERLVKLPRDDEEGFRAYAAKWGMLGVCEPDQHDHGHGPCPHLPWDRDDLWPQGEYWESLEHWRVVSRQAKLILTIAAGLQEGLKARLTPEETALLCKWYVFSIWPDDSLEEQREEVARVISAWLFVGEARPTMQWKGSHPEVLLGGSTLYGALGVQLMMAISGKGGFAVCTSCGGPFVPRGRRPAFDRGRYCPDCGIRASRSLAKQRYRLRGAGRLPPFERRKRSGKP